jgi:MoaA/NifB/PqqE/SkfB family radical SAM enzyme
MRTIELRMDVTNTCNLRCIMCHLPYLHQQPHMMSSEEFMRITSGVLHKTNTLYLSWATEPMINPHLADIIRATRAANIPCVVMVSNLTHFPDAVADAINGIHRLHVSVDSVDRNVYKAIRQKDCLDQVLENVKKVNELKKKHGWKYPHIAFNAVLLRMNIGLLEPLVDRAASLGVNELNLSYISIPERYNDGSLRQKLIGLPEDFNLKNEAIAPGDPQAAAAIAKAIAYAEKKGVLITVAGRFSLTGGGTVSRNIGKAMYIIRKGLRFPPWSLLHLACSYVGNLSTMRKSFCSFPFRQMVLTADGLVLPCCVWDDREGLGDVKSSTLEEIWKSEPFTRLRGAMLDVNGDIPRICAACTRVNSKKRHGV